MIVLAVYGTRVMIDSRPAPETREVARPVPVVATLTAHSANLTLKIMSEGTVAPHAELDLVPEVSGRVVELSPALVDGGFFEAGDVLLRLDARDYELALAQARAAVAQANLALEMERQEALVAIDEWELLGEGRPAPLVLREPQIAQAEATLASAEAAHRLAEVNLERTVMRAPFAGRVRQEQVEAGQFISRGAPIARIYAIDYAEVELPIQDSELAYLDLPYRFRASAYATPSSGPRVVLRAEFGGRAYSWNGIIVRTTGEIDPATRMIHAIARVENPYGTSSGSSRPPLAVGMFVEAEIQGNRSGKVFALPRSVLRDAGEVLIVDSQSRLRIRQVDIFRQEPDRVLIRSGIQEGDQIIVSPLENAVSGMKVRLQPADDDAGLPESPGP